MINWGKNIYLMLQKVFAFCRFRKSLNGLYLINPQCLQILQRCHHFTDIFTIINEDDPMVILESKDLWRRFSKHGNEMVVTKTGR